MTDSWPLSSWMLKQPLMTCKAKCGTPSVPWQRMRASRSMPAWVSHCKCSTWSCRFPDISFHMQIPLTITYCPESSVYRRLHPEQGGVSPLHKEIRASRTLSKVLGRVTHQPSESVGGPPSPAPSHHSVRSSGSLGSRCRSCSQAKSVTPVHSQQSGSVGSSAGHHSIHFHATKDDEVSSS